MNSRVSYVAADVSHAEFVGQHMRAADRAEVWASHGLCPRVAAVTSVRASSVAVAGLRDGLPVGIFGVVPVSTIDGIGAPWMLGTDGAVALAREWLVEAPQWLTLISDGYVMLRNYVDARNARSKAWLRRMGFRLAPAAPYGVHGMAFHYFERIV